MPTLQQRCFAAARRCADWFVHNQIYDMATADSGRYLSEIRVKNLSRPIGPSIAWTTGMTAQALLMMYQRTKDEEYLTSVKRAGEYLKTLQILDPRTAKNFGMLREIHTQTDWAHPRDALSGAWAMLKIGQALKDRDYLQRAVLFGGWFKKYAFKNGYPAWTTYVGNRKPYWQLGSFHGGSALFFIELFQLTGDREWLDQVVKPLLATYMKYFIKDDGSIRIVVDEKTKKDLTDVKDNNTGWKHMHKYNDDFTALAFMRAYRVSGDEKYLNVIKRYMEWALTQQNPDGSFGAPPPGSGCATLIIELLDLYGFTRDQRWRRAAERAAGYLLGLQQLAKKNKQVYGGVYGETTDYRHGQRDTLNIRTASYALAAYLKLEGRRKYACYTA